MAESVATGVFVDSDFENGGFYGALHKESLRRRSRKRLIRMTFFTEIANKS